VDPVAQFCFAERRELFGESFLRGWYQGCIDFPQHSLQPGIAGIADDLRPGTCCIDDELAYLSLVVSAWVCGYKGTETVTPRDLFIMATALKPLSQDEGMALLRRGTARDTSEIDKAYAQFIEKFQEARTNV
jgi:hypothetical protein